MRIGFIVVGLSAALSGLLIMLFVPDIIAHYTEVDVRAARVTVEPVTYTSTVAYGTQWSDFIGNTMLMLGLILAVIGLAAHEP